MARLRFYIRDAARAVERAPAEVSIALVTAVELSYAFEAGNDAFLAWTALAVANVLALFVAWSATMLHALGQVTARTRWTITLLGVLFAAGYGSGLDPQHASEWWRALMLVSAFGCITLAVPAWVRSPDDPNLRLRRINGRVLLRSLGIGLYGLALFAGLALALAAIKALFELKMDNEIYGHVFGWIMLAVVPWVIAGGLHDYVRPLDQRSDVAGVVQRLAAYLVPPLLALYYLILYAYAIRIGVTGEVPKNLVSPMVLAAAFLGVLALLLFDPRPNDAPGLRALRLAPPLFIPVGLLGLWAITPRIDQYGWTEFRLLRIELLVLFVLLAFFGTLQFARKRAFALRVIPVVLAAGLLIGAVGPWSVTAVSKRDQQQRLEIALRQAQINLDLPRAPGDTMRRFIGGKIYDQIQGSAIYLQQHFGEEAFSGILPRHAVDALATMQLPEYYGLARLGGPQVEVRGAFADLPENQAIQLPDGSIAYRVRLRERLENRRVAIQGDTLRFSLGADTLRADLASLLTRLRAAAPAREPLPATPYALTVTDQRGANRGTLLVLSIGETARENEPRQVQYIDALFILAPSPQQTRPR